MVDVVLAGGRNFMALGRYLVEGSRGKPRVEHALGDCFYFNLPVVRGPLHAFGIMAATARDADALKRLARIPPGGRAGEKSVYHFVLSLSVDEKVTSEQVRAAVEEALLELGLEDRQAVAIVHVDTGHLHVHVVANRVSLEDGRFANMGRDRIKLSRWAKSWEQRTFGRTFCRRPDRDENLRVDKRTYNRPGSYPVRYRNRKRPVRDEHYREAWRSLLNGQRDQLDAARKAGGDVAALEKKQKMERVKLSRRLRRIEKQGWSEDPKRVEPQEVATGATSGQDRKRDTDDAAKVPARGRPGPVNMSEPARGPLEVEAPGPPSGPADETRSNPDSEPAHLSEVERVEATQVKESNQTRGGVSAVEKEKKAEQVRRLAHELSRMEEQRSPEEDSRVHLKQAATVATSRRDRAPDTDDNTKTRAPDKPAPANSTEPAARALESEAPKAPPEPADEIRLVPISEGSHAPAVKCVEATGVKQPNEATAGNEPTPQAVQRRIAQQTPESSGLTQTPAKSVARDASSDRSEDSPYRGRRQESMSASPVAPPQEARRDVDSRSPRKSAEQFRGTERRPAEDVKRSPDERTGGTVKRVRDHPVLAADLAMKAVPDGPGSIGEAAGPVRKDTPVSAASSVLGALPMPTPAADEAPAAGVTRVETGQTGAATAGAAPARPADQRRTPTQAVESAVSHPSSAKPAHTVVSNRKPGRNVDTAHPTKSTSISSTAAATSAGTRNDDRQPSEVCIADYGREPEQAVAIVAAVAGIKLKPSENGRLRVGRLRKNVVYVPTMPTRDAQHAYDLWVCARVAPPPPLAKLGEEQLAVGAASVAEGLADTLGTRKTFDAGRKQLEDWPPPAAAPLRNIIRQAVEWFVEQLRLLFKTRRNERDRKLRAFKRALGRFTAGGTMDDLTRTFVGRAIPITTARNPPAHSSANRAPEAATPPASGGLVARSRAASRKTDRTATRTPPVASSSGPPVKSISEASVSAASGRTDDRQRLGSTSRKTAPTATPTRPPGASRRGQPAPKVQTASIEHAAPEPDELEAALGGNSRPRVSQVAESPPSSQSVSGRTAAPAATASGEQAVRMIADGIARELEADHLPRKVPAGILVSVREAAGDREDIGAVVDALLERVENSGDDRDRQRAEREYLEHLPEVFAARTQTAEPEPEQRILSRLTSWFTGGGAPPETATPPPDPTTVLDDARRRHVGELVETISNYVRDRRESLEEPLKLDAGPSRASGDERWRAGRGPTTPDHDHGHDRG